MKKSIIILIALAICIPLYSQDKKEAKETKDAKETTKEVKDEKAGDKQKLTVYQEILLEDFETSLFTDKNITFNRTSDQEAKLMIRDQQPATPNSKKYLGIKIKTRGGDIFVIKPIKELVIDKYCKSISMWVYGKRSLGELSILLQDTTKQNHRITIVPAIDFIGWKKFTIPLSNKIAQQDDFLNQKKTMKIMTIQYKSAGAKDKPSQWQYIYIDDISATVRERYDDKQSDEW